MHESPSQDWVASLTSGEASQAEALEALREMLLMRVRRALASNRKVNDAFVEDVVQEGLISILRSLNGFRGHSQFETWATTITLRGAFAEMRRARWKDVSLEQVLEGGVSSVQRQAKPNDAANRLLGTQLVAAMHRIIREELTDKQRTALQAELRGMPQEEIGRRLGSNRNAVYKLVHDARKRLRKGLLEAGYSAEDLASLAENSA